MSCQKAASKGWNLFHIDLKTASLQRQSYDVNRYVVGQLPPEASNPPYIAARLKKPWWNILDMSLRSYGMVPTRADRCCCVLYSTQPRERAWEHWEQKTITQQYSTGNVLTQLRERSQMDAAFEKRWIH